MFAGGALSGDVVSWNYFTSLQGQRVDISMMNGDFFVDDAKIEQVDLLASNGVIHVIDAVMLPALDNALETVQSTGDLSDSRHRHRGLQPHPVRGGRARSPSSHRSTPPSTTCRPEC